MPFPRHSPGSSTTVALCEFTLDKAGQLLKESASPRWRRPASSSSQGNLPGSDVCANHAGGPHEDRLQPQPAGSAAVRRRAPSSSAKTTRWRCITYGRAQRTRDHVRRRRCLAARLRKTKNGICSDQYTKLSTRPLAPNDPEKRSLSSPTHRVRAGPALHLPLRLLHRYLKKERAGFLGAARRHAHPGETWLA